MADLDPYLTWLDIPADQRPVDRFRLLGLPSGESDPAKIQSAAQRVTEHLQQFRGGEHNAAAQQLLTEVELAQSELLSRSPGTLQQDEKAKFETVIRSPPPVPGGGDLPSQTVGIKDEQQITAPPPPPGQSSQPSTLRPTIQTTPPPPGHASPPQVPSGPPAPSPPPPSVPTGGMAPAPVTPPPGVPAGPTPPPAQPVAPPSLPTMTSPQVTPVAKPANAESGPAPAPTWAPEGRTGRVGKAVAAAEPTRKRSGRRTHEAKAFRRKVRRESKHLLHTVTYAIAAVLIGIIALLVLVAVK